MSLLQDAKILKKLMNNGHQNPNELLKKDENIIISATVIGLDPIMKIKVGIKNKRNNTLMGVGVKVTSYFYDL
jgi:hypothetical protein